MGLIITLAIIGAFSVVGTLVVVAMAIIQRPWASIPNPYEAHR